MSKIIVSQNITLDGYMAGDNCELDWHFRFWDDEMSEYASRDLNAAGAVLLGRVTHQAMSRYWPSRVNSVGTSREDIAFANLMNNHRKYVVSRKLDNAGWNNSIILRSLTLSVLDKLRRGTTGDIIVYGSGQLVNRLIALDRVDEFILWTHPVLLFSGKPAFPGNRSPIEMTLHHSKVLESGVIMQRYFSNSCPKVSQRTAHSRERANEFNI